MKKIISIALALLMVAVMLPVMAMAEEPATALPTADANGVITLEKDVVLADAVEINSVVTIDLHGWSITSSNGNSGKVIIAMANVTIKDSVGNGRIESTSTSGGSSAAIRVGTAGTDKDITVTIESGTMKGRDCGIFVAGINSKLVVNGGYIEGTNGFGVSGNGSMKNGVSECGPTTITINGGKIIGGGTGIYHPQVGQLMINNGEITGKTGVEIRAGGLIVSGGTITATGDSISTNPNGNGTTTVGAAVAIAQHTTKKGIAVTINGGTFTGKAALLESNPQNNGTDYTRNISVNVSGGTFNGAVNKADDGSYLGVMGGTFKTNVTPYVGETLVVENNDTYFVGGTAIDAVQNATGGTFTVVAVPDEPVKFENVTPGVTVNNGTDNGNVTVNENEVKPGKSYTVPGAPIIIYPPTEDTPKANDQKNPGTGANDFVGVAAAMAVVSLLGAAAVIRKK